MNDEQMRSLLDAAYRDREIPPPKVQTGVASVMGHVPRTRQRSRWWPFPVLYRRAKTPTSTALQPSPIPATNGQTPTVIGRTRTMFSPTKAITAAALVFGIGGVLFIAQLSGQQGSAPPGAATEGTIDPCATPIVYVTGHIIWGSEEPGAEVFSSGGSQRIRGQVYVNTMDIDDERLDGPATTNLDWDITGGGASNDTIRRGSIHIENAAGAWDGSFDGIGQWEKLRNVLSVTGSGGYEGLSATLLHVSNDDIGGVIEGAIYPTDIASCDFSAE